MQFDTATSGTKMTDKKAFTAVRSDGAKKTIWAESRAAALVFLQEWRLTGMYSLEGDIVPRKDPFCVKSCYGFWVPID